ncbi:hypothetical protein JG687_00019726, partial [Phytophthora cactorum]
MVTARKFRLGSLLCKHLLQRWNTLSPSWMKTWQRSSLAHRPLEVRPPVGCTTISLHCALRCGRWARGLGEGKGDRITLKYPPTRFLLPHWVSLSFAQTKEPLRWCHCPILWTPDIELALALSPADSLSRDGVFNSTPATRINTCSLYCAWGGLIQALNAWLGDDPEEPTALCGYIYCSPTIFYRHQAALGIIKVVVCINMPVSGQARSSNKIK